VVRGKDIETTARRIPQNFRASSSEKRADEIPIESTFLMLQILKKNKMSVTRMDCLGRQM